MLASFFSSEKSILENQYNVRGLSENLQEIGDHRAFVGGLWDTVGQLQFDYMMSKGLSPADRFVDVACGALRGGRFFIPYLVDGHYHGFDILRELIDAGLEHEIEPKELVEKTPLDNFFAARDFAFPENWRDIDSGIAVSLFTHLTMNSIALCLNNLRGVMKDEAYFYATIFHVTEKEQMSPHEQQDGIVTSLSQDPYHYTRTDMDYLARKTGWRVETVEEFDHPRGQSMVVFQKR